MAAPAAFTDAMSVPPLTHHDILALVAPFAGRGLHVDLKATDRMARRLVFRSREHPACGALPALRETLVLDEPGRDRYRLMRMLVTPEGIEAKLEAQGKGPAELLEQLESVPLARQIRAADGFVVAFHHRMVPGGPAIAAARIRTATLDVEVRVPVVAGPPADLVITPLGDARFELPEDLLAVQGWPWGRISPSGPRFTGALRLPRREPARSAAAERLVERTATHLVRTLAEPPARFHERFRAARWGVTLRRAVPLLVVTGVLGAMFVLREHVAPGDSIVRMLAFQAPPILLLLVFALPETPRIEIPPLPRRPRGTTWRTAPRP